MALSNKLKDNKISYGIHYPKPLPFLKAYKYLKLNKNDYPVANNIQFEILSIPLYPEITKKQINFICKVINTL